jgi:spermidine synthase
MGGLACGSYFMGRMLPRFERHHPLVVYAVIEILIAAVALLIPVVLQSLVPVYQWVWRSSQGSWVMFSLVRFALSALVLLVPTFLMGATLPVLSSFVSRDTRRSEQRIGLLYSFNTLGAVLGCAAAGLVLFPMIGRSNTLWVAIALNLIAAAGSYLLARGQRRTTFPAVPNLAADLETTGVSEGSEAGGTPAQLSRREAGLLVTLYACSGFVAMLYEVAWSRVLVLALGCSTYAYTIMLTTFLLGLALGAWLATRWLARMTYPLLAAGLCQVVIALATYLSVFLVGELPFLYAKAYGWLNPSAGGLLYLQFLIAAGLMILPTIGLGAMFPITIHGLNPRGRKAAGVVGWAYALNTVGAIVGSVLAGFWLVPRLGSQNTLLAGIALNALLGLLAIASVRRGPLARHRAFAAVLLVVFCGNLFYATPR